MKKSPTRQLTLIKGEERYIFRYSPGQERQIMDAMAEMAGNKDSAFDWFDAAVLSYQMGRKDYQELSDKVNS